MTLIETLGLPVRPERAWDLLVERRGALELVAGLNPTGDGRGTLRMALGEHSVTYRGYARQHVEEPYRHVTWTMSGREVRGTGRAHAEIRARFKEMAGGGTDLRLTVLVEGRGRLDELPKAERDQAVSAAVARFRRALLKRLAEEEPVRSEPAARPRPPTPERPRTPAPELEIMPPSPSRGGAATRSVSVALGGLLLGALAVLAWRAWSHKNR